MKLRLFDALIAFGSGLAIGNALSDCTNRFFASAHATVPIQHVDAPTTQAVAPVVRGRAHAGRQNPTPLGDMDCNGVVEFADVNHFVNVVLGHFGQYLVSVGYECAKKDQGDMNQDGATNVGDVNIFVNVLLGAPSPDRPMRIYWSRLQEDPQGRELYDPNTEPSPK